MWLPDPITPVPLGPLTLLISDSDLLEHILWSSLTRSASSSEPKESLWSKVNVSERSSSKGLFTKTRGELFKMRTNQLSNMEI